MHEAAPSGPRREEGPSGELEGSARGEEVHSRVPEAQLPSPAWPPLPRELSHNQIEGLPSLHGCQKLEEM